MNKEVKFFFSPPSYHKGMLVTGKKHCVNHDHIIINLKNVSRLLVLYMAQAKFTSDIQPKYK